MKNLQSKLEWKSKDSSVKIVDREGIGTTDCETNFFYSNPF